MKLTAEKFILSIAVILFLVWSHPVSQAAEGESASIPKTVERMNPDTSPFKGALPDEKRQIDLTFDDMDIYPVLDEVLGNILELNFIVEPSIRGTISVRIQGKYSRHDLLDLFNSMLQIYGLAIVHGDYGLYKVVKKSSSSKQGSSVISSTGRKINPGDVTRVFQLKYLSAPHALANIKSFISPGAVIIAVPSSNSIVLTDTAENLRKVTRIISLLDTNLFKHIHWKLFSLETTDPADMAKDLQSIFKSKGLFARPGIDSDSLQIITLNSINAILVITRWKEVLKEIELWVAELEKGQIEKGSNVYVYFVQNGKAKDLADLLNNLYAKSSSKSSSNKKVLVKRTQKGKVPVKTEAAGELSGEVKILADEPNNALVIKAKPKDYTIIKDVLDKLDIMPRQVLVEVMIAEVQLQDELAYGVEWFIKQKGINISGNPYNADMALTIPKAILGENTHLGEGSPDFSYGLFNNNGDLMALIMLLDATTNFNLLSTPNILASDNQEASIEIGEDVPVLSESTISTGGVKTQGVQYRKTGIILHVKPTINDNGLVRMEITQEVSSVNKEATSGITSPRITNRKASTFLVAHDGQHILIGGIMRTEMTETSLGIPILKDLPLLGYLFGSTGTNKRKKELIFIVTPHVIKSKRHADELTREFTEKMNSLKNMLSHEGIMAPSKSIKQQKDKVDQ